MHTHVRRCPAHMLRMCMCMCMYLRCRYADTVPMDGLVLFTRQSTPDTDAGVRTVFKRMGNKRMATEGATPSSAFLNTNLPNSPPAPDTERDIQEHAAACKANGALYPHALAHAHIACACTCTCTCACACTCACYMCMCMCTCVHVHVHVMCMQRYIHTHMHIPLHCPSPSRGRHRCCLQGCIGRARRNCRTSTVRCAQRAVPLLGHRAAVLYPLAARAGRHTSLMLPMHVACACA